jgi:uncharacterized protein
LSYLTEWTSPETLEAGAMAGPMLETWVFAELLQSYWHNGRRAPFNYYRDEDQREIDLVISRDGNLYPPEIRRTAAPSLRDLGHFAALQRLGLPVGPGGVICLTPQAIPLAKGLWSIPVAAL